MWKMEEMTVYQYSRRPRTMCEHLLEFSITSSWRKQYKGAAMLLFVINCTGILKVHLKEPLYLNLVIFFFFNKF